ncbi:MAG: methyl-accepting chemotaxis protein, partial [Clostridia bacterium]|nr:methyl-accepting chemotaxis protein [Clostridia bacterium]
MMVGVVVAWAVRTSLTRPLVVLEQAAAKVAAGDLTVAWDIRSKDEIGSPAAPLARMVQHLQRSVKKVIENANQVAAAVRELGASTDQNARAASQVTQTAQELAAGSDRQNQA